MISGTQDDFDNRPALSYLVPDGISSRREGQTGIVTLNWPEDRNAMTSDRMERLAEELGCMADDPAIRCVVLTGVDGSFCAGGNLRGVARKANELSTVRREAVEGAAQGVIRALLAMPVPTIAAIDGPAVGFGFDIALACDMRLVGERGWCMQGWGRVGLIAGSGGVMLLEQLNPVALWPLLAEQPRLDGESVEALGLGENVSGRALEAAVHRAEKLGRLPRAALEGYVELSRASLRSEIGAHHERCTDLQADLLGDPGVGERIKQILGR